MNRHFLKIHGWSWSQARKPGCDLNNDMIILKKNTNWLAGAKPREWGNDPIHSYSYIYLSLSLFHSPIPYSYGPVMALNFYKWDYNSYN